VTETPETRQTTEPQVAETGNETPETKQPDASDVTREQNGQFIEESSGIERVVVPHRNQAGGKLNGADLDSIRAKNVTMDRSGAENIEAEQVSMTNAGAKSIRSTTVDMQNSGSMTVTGDTVTMNQSSAMVVAGQNIEVSQGAVLMLQAESATLQGASRVGMMVAGNVKTNQDLKVGFGVVGKVEGGEVKVAVTPQAAVAFGAGFAVVWAMLRRVFRRKS